MKLIEAEAKQLLHASGVPVPEFFLLEKDELAPVEVHYPVMIKAQTLLGGRGKAGLVKQAADVRELQQQIDALWQRAGDKRSFERLLVEPKAQAVREYYVSITFDTGLRGPVLIFSKFGGMDIEVVSKRQPQAVLQLPIDPLAGADAVDFARVYEIVGVKPELQDQLRDIVLRMYACFVENDAEIVEVNPLIETVVDGAPAFVAADAKISLDDTALFRHEFSFPRRTGFRELTDMEKAARAIDAESHRGVAGRTFLELDGDIAFMSSGGGASITCLDALTAYGGRPANFVEYSGNPERDKVYKLARLVLSKPGLRALWVVGPTANFTDVYETLGGVMDAIREVRPAYPIVIRRAGPRDQEAKAMVEATARELNLDLTFLGEEVSMTESAKYLMSKISTE